MQIFAEMASAEDRGGLAPSVVRQEWHKHAHVQSLVKQRSKQVLFEAQIFLCF